jgi:hypothetical protein
MRRAVLAASVAAALCLVAASVPAARGAGDATGNLVTGGTAKGDISKAPGEFDTITVDLVAGSRANVTLHANFAASYSFTDPANSAVDLGLASPRGGTVRGWSVPATGQYTLRIASADGSQGTYSFTIQPFWDKTVVLTGSDQADLAIAMPAASYLKGKLQPLPGAANPSILAFTAPDGTPLLADPVVGSANLAKLPTTQCSAPGTYTMTATAAGGTRQFRATLKRKAPKVPRANINITNGLDGVSYAASIADTFDHRCANCHGWAANYAGVKAYARSSLPRIKSGDMPKGSPRLDSAFVDTFAQWIATGYGQ